MLNNSPSAPAKTDVYVVDAARSPFLKARGKPGPFTAADLAVQTAQRLMFRNQLPVSVIDEVITGCVMPSVTEANISRIIAMRIGCDEKVPAWTVQRNCASGMQAVHSAMQSIQAGDQQIVLAGGCEVMSHAPLLFNEAMVNWFAAWAASKTFSQRTKVLTQLRPQFFMPVIALLKGLNDPLVDLSMGQTAEILADRFKISREQMDQFSLQSHQRLAQAVENKHIEELISVYDSKGGFYAQDDGLRADTTIEKLAKLKPFFDKKFGLVTPGNSSQITDGASFLILASKQAVEKYQLPVLGRLRGCQWMGVDPAQMGLGPAHAVPPLLQRFDLQASDIDYWEINEAFAGQVLACLTAWQDQDYCKEQLGLQQEFVSRDIKSQLNIDGGAVAIGHPVAGSGARIISHLLYVLRRKQARLGVASLCIGGGQGGAMLVENVNKVV